MNKNLCETSCKGGDVKGDINNDREASLMKKIEGAMNSVCAENKSNTPDFILAEYLMDCLIIFNKHTIRRDKWYAVHLEPANKFFIDKDKECTESNF